MDLKQWITDLWVGKGPTYESSLLQSPEQKLHYIDDQRAAMLVHGPGAPPWGEHRTDGNSAVFACLRAICNAYPEAPLRVWRRVGPKEREELHEHPMMQLLRRPNDEMPMSTIWWWVQWAKNADGNAYLRKLRSGNPRTGNVVNLWPISPNLIRPVTVKGSDDFISYYRYEPAPGKEQNIPPENILHFRLGVDDRDHRLGCAPLKRLVRQVATDEEATRFSDALLRNYAVPGLVVTPPKEAELTRDEAVELKARLQGEYGSDNRGNVAVLSPGATMATLGFSPQDMQVQVLHRIPEERISAVIGVPAIVAGLGAGLDRSTYSNVREAREMFTEQTLVPSWKADAETVNLKLTPDFVSDPSVFADFDTSEVRALQEDRDKLYARVTSAFKEGVLERDEARSELGFEPLGDVAPVVTTQDQAAKFARLLVEHKATGGDLPALYAAMLELAEPSFRRDLESYYDEQRVRVKRALVGS